MGSLLEQIRGPGDLRALPAEKLPELAAEVRERIIEVVGRTGGHLASNLGAVELAIALHRTFDFSRDRLVLDVGHQCYAHKMLTGRAGRFETLRQKGGLSGFPQPGESEYDPFVVGHASTAISSALGLACAAEIAGEAKHVVALVGDGSMTGGLAYEGLNQAGHLKRKLLVVLNDNAMAIAPTVGALQAYLGRMRAVPFYNQMRDEFRDALARLPVLGKPLELLVEKSLDAAKRVLTPGHIFYELGFRYFGPVNGHDIPGLISAIEDVKKLPGPVLLHVLTEKGRGYAPASKDPAAFHSATPGSVHARLDYEPGEGSPPPKREQYTGVFSRELLALGGSDKRVVAITAAMPSGTGLDAFAREFPGRYFDAGIAEAHAITFAAALAAGSLRPVVVIYSTFLQRAYDQILHDLCLQEKLGVVIGIDRAGLVGGDGATHQGLYDVAFLRHMPGMVLCAPKDAAELGAMLRFAVELGGPVAIRYPRDEAISLGECPPVELARSETLREGADCAILAYGAAVEWALGAAGILAAGGVSARVVNARFAKPLDDEMLRAAFARGSLVATVEDGLAAGAFGSAVLERASELGLRGRALSLGAPDRILPHASRRELIAELGLTPEAIAARIRKELGR